MKMMLESAYALIVLAPDIVVKKTSTITAYHLFLNYGNDGHLDIAYTYDSKTYEFLGVRVDRVPNKRAVLLGAKDNMCDIIFVGNVEDK